MSALKGEALTYARMWSADILWEASGGRVPVRHIGNPHECLGPGESEGELHSGERILASEAVGVDHTPNKRDVSVVSDV